VKTRIIIIAVLLLFVLLYPSFIPASAQGAGANTTDLWQSINDIIEDLRKIVLAGGTLVIIGAGVMYISGAFNPDNVGTAKTIITTTVIGLIFMLLYPTIISVLSEQGLIPPEFEETPPAIETTP